MRKSNPRKLALKVLNGQPDGIPLFTRYLGFQDDPDLDARDKAFTVHLVQGVLRWRGRLDWIIEQYSNTPLKKIKPSVLNILRMAVYQIFFMDRVPDSAAVNEAVKQAKAAHPTYIVSFVNGLLRSVCRHKDDRTFPDCKREPVRFLSVYHAYPEWLVRQWIRALGERETEALLHAQNRIPVLDARVNRLRVGRSQLIQRLEAEGARAVPLEYSPDGIRVAGIRGQIDRLPSFREGLFQVQNQAAQITSHLISPRPGERILDICAGLGGKTTHMAEMTGNRARIIALDIQHRRLVNLLSNAGRLGVKNVEAVTADATGPLESLFREAFDKIVVDAPCSGLGVLSGHPDVKWNRREEDIDRLSRLQKTMLAMAAPLLRPGGRLLYITCTISEAENEGVVVDFLQRQSRFRMEDLREWAPEWGRNLINEKGFYQTFPHQHDTDGFFAALLSKR